MGSAPSVGDPKVQDQENEEVIDPSKLEAQMNEVFDYLRGQYQKKMRELGHSRVLEIRLRKKMFLKAQGFVDIRESASPRHKAARMLGDEQLQRELQLAVPKGTAITNKVMNLMGDIQLSGDKVKDKLGHEMTSEQKIAMREAEKREAEVRSEVARKMMSDVLRSRPCDTQFKVAPTNKPVSNKARLLISDEKLEKQAFKLVDKDKVNAKAIQLAGNAESLAPRKAAEMLGDEMGLSARKKQSRGRLYEEKMKEQQAAEEIDTIVKRQPSKKITKQPSLVSSKAAEKLGVQLGEGTNTLLPEDLGSPSRQKSTKTAKVFGEPVLVSKKVADRLGDGMKAEQVRAMRKAESKEDLKKKKKQVLRAPSTGGNAE